MQEKKVKELVLLTAGFPYGPYETFLETEILFLAKAFDKIHIIAVDPINKTPRLLPENCSVATFSLNNGWKEKINSLTHLFTTLFWNECFTILFNYKLSINRKRLFILINSLNKAQKLKNFIKKNHFLDTQSTFYSYWADNSAIALGLLKKEGYQNKMITRAHGYDVYFNVHQHTYLPFRAIISNYLDGIYPISDAGKKAIFEQWLAKPTEKIKTHRLGVLSKTVNFNTEKQPITIVSCSNLFSVKRVDLIAAALTYINKPIKWVHFGEGPERQKVEKIIKGINNDIVVDLKGSVSNNDVLNYYTKNTPFIFINVSSSEGIPVSIMEAFSFGIPVIATDVGGNGEIVNEENGTLVPADISATELSEIIQEYIEMNEESYDKKRLAACKTCEEEFNAWKNYGEFIEHSQDL